MKYKLTDRIQYESYCCVYHLIYDVIETLLDESIDIESVHIIADKDLIEELIKVICQTTVNDFEFELSCIDFQLYNDEIDEYRMTIFDDGSVYIEPAIDKNAEYYDCDGFIFAECEVSEDAYSGNNRHCDVMVFDVEGF